MEIIIRVLKTLPSYLVVLATVTLVSCGGPSSRPAVSSRVDSVEMVTVHPGEITVVADSSETDGIER